MIYINFNSKDLVVEWMSFNLVGLTDLKLLRVITRIKNF